jgi:hypothetical protein
MPVLGEAIETVKQFGYRLVEPGRTDEGGGRPPRGERR